MPERVPLDSKRVRLPNDLENLRLKNFRSYVWPVLIALALAWQRPKDRVPVMRLSLKDLVEALCQSSNKLKNKEVELRLTTTVLLGFLETFANAEYLEVFVGLKIEGGN